jgi:hypothetical protein
MRKLALIILPALLIATQGFAEDTEDFVEKKEEREIEEFDFIGYYFMRSELSNVAPTNEFLKGQVVGRLFGGNTTQTSDQTSCFIEQRFMPMITYSPRLFDGWAKMRMSFEFDWTWGDANYGAGGNFGGAFAGDFVNMQTQNLFIEFRPQKNLFINAGLLRLYDNVQVPYYTFTDHLIYKGYRLALFGSDATGIGAHWFFDTDKRIKIGAYQLYENNVEEDDDVQLFEIDVEKDLDIENSVGLSLHYVRDYANGEGGVSILGQGLNCGLSNYNGVFNFDFGNEDYHADIFWVGTHFHGDPLLYQGRFGYSGFAFWNLGVASTATRDVKINGFAANLRLAHQWGPWHEDQIALDNVFTTGDSDNISDDTYNGVLTGNNWTAPGAVFFSHGLYLLLPHGNVVNRFNAAVIDIQNIGYGLKAAALSVSKELVPNKWRLKAAAGSAWATETISGMGSAIGTEVNLSLRYRLRVFMDLELHAAHLWLGDFYDSPVVNGGAETRPDNPWTAFLTFKWIMF